VTHLRQLMIEELQRRNFAETTIRFYVHGVEHFSLRRPYSTPACTTKHEVNLGASY
jgi:hypothetical protein